MHHELKGDALSWGTDKFLEVIFYNTHAEIFKLLLPQENPLLQTLYNNAEMMTNFKIILAESQREILVHDYILMGFSKMFSKMLVGDWKEKNNGFSFKEPDAVVEQFLRVCYGYPPELDQCDLIDLLHFARFVDSPLFTNLINTIFNENITDWDIASIKMMIDSNVWSLLPQKKPFFETVGLLWTKIIELVAVEEREDYRQEFIADWYDYLSKKPLKPLEVSLKKNDLTALF
jgi:hypothetical protein